MSTTLNKSIDEWRRKLLDTGKRSQFISLKMGKTGAIRLVHPDASVLWDRLVGQEGKMVFPYRSHLLGLGSGPEDEDEGPAVRQAVLYDLDARTTATDDRNEFELEACRNSPHLRGEHVLTDLMDKPLRTSLDRLARNATTSISEQGVPTLYLTFGMLRRYESPDSKEPILSPLLLFPAELHRETIDSPWALKLQNDEEEINHSLVQLLNTDFRIVFPALPHDLDRDSNAWRLAYFDSIRNVIRDQKRWEVLDDCALGIFSFQKIAMWDDLDQNRDQIIGHDLCRAIAGDPTIELRSPKRLPQARELDDDVQTQPELTYHILDSDSSQHEAIEAAKRGASLILDGPPGTGKSQTIANIIAEFLAMGKTVLFVSEKSAALEVVKRRLDAQGLGDFCLEFHSQKVTRKQVLAELGRCLNLQGVIDEDRSEDLNHLQETRQALNAYVRALHAVRQPLGLSAFQVHGRLAAVQSAPNSRCSVPVPDVTKMKPGRLRELQEMLDSLTDCREAIRNHDSHPWRGIKQPRRSLTFKADMELELERLDRGLAPIAAAAPKLSTMGFLPDTPGIPEWLNALERMKDVPSYPIVPASWFQAANPRQIADAHIELDQITREYRQAREAMPEFSEDVVLQIAPDILKAILAPLEDGLCLGPHDHETVLTLRSHLLRIEVSLKELADKVRATNRAMDAVLGVLGIKPRSFPVQSLGKVKGLLERIGKTAIRPAWLDDRVRQEVQVAVDRCQREEKIKEQCRLDLIDRMSPRVFDDPESWDLASRALPYLRSRWKRLMPGWWGLQGRIAALYFRDAPGPSLMLADLERLSLYRSQVNYAREVRRQYADHLIARDDGTTNWDQTIDGLKESKLFDPLLRVMPELTDVLIDPSRIDSRAWRDALDQFSSVHAAFLGAREEVNRVIDLNRVLEPNGKISADNLAAWLERQSKALEGSITRLNWIAGLLKPARDVTLMELPARIASIDTLLKCGTSIDRLCANLACSSEAASARDRDWSDLRRIAEWTLSFLDQHHDHPPNELIRAATTPEIREDLIHAVRANLEARTDEFLTSWENLVDRFGPDQDVSTGIQLGSSPVADLHEWVRARRLDTERIQEWVSFSETRDKMTQTGLSLLMSDLLDGSVPVEEAKNAFLARFYRAWLDEVRRDVPELGRFATDTHERDIKQFVDLDNKSIQLTYKRIRQLLLNDPDRPRASTLNAPSSSELGVLLREVNKKTRHLSLRELFAQVPTILPRLKPCLMMSPLTVSTYLNSRDIRFDVVIFDEASQVRPHDAISSIYRGRQLIVAGDQKQLPPTNFFERSEDYEDGSIEEKQDEGNLADFESILDVCCTLQLARRRLRWHYRSRREPLIAFSNRHFYGNELVTFPSVDDTDETPAVRFEYLADGRWTGGFNRVEARKVAQMVMDHVLSNPSWSLGVIAFSRRQQEAIYDELDRLRRRDGSLESFFEEERDDPFFVKNLENVQGDERDVIFLSIGYGPDENGRVSMRFGPLNRLGGERRLNVAITRARLGMTVISSMKAHDIDLTRSKAEGVRLLRAYLDFAERGAAALASEITESDERDHDSPFEQQVAEALTRRGMQVRKQVGCGGFRIDLALVDPDRPGRFVLGIECDGATYHSSATARDRDRLRQQVLESLGWRIVRIWSTDWVKDPNHQINRVVAAFHQRLSEGPGPRTPTPGSVAPEVLPDELPVMLQHDTSVPLNPPKARYQKIEAVPEREIEDMIVASLKRNGTTDEPELIKSIVKELGFKRTGGRIHAKIKDRIDHLLSAAQIARCSDNGLRLIPDSGLKLA